MCVSTSLFKLTDNVPLYGSTPYVCPFISRHLGCSDLSAIVNAAAVCICVQFCVDPSFLFSWVDVKSTLTGSRGESVSAFQVFSMAAFCLVRQQGAQVLLPGESQGRGRRGGCACGAAPSRTRLTRLSSSILSSPRQQGAQAPVSPRPSITCFSFCL